MRFLAFAICIGLTACISAPETSVETVASPAAPFVVPMDPGQISCANLSNQSALNEATAWTMGRARAAVLAGRRAQTPSEPELAQSLITFCNRNSGANLSSAATQLGV